VPSLWWNALIPCSIMGTPNYRSVEGRLYALGGFPEARVARPHLEARTAPRGSYTPQGTPPREAVDRLDLTLAVRQLMPEDKAVIEEHYILGARRHRGQDRVRAVNHLRALLDDG
jgi:hypothetical protein